MRMWFGIAAVAAAAMALVLTVAEPATAADPCIGTARCPNLQALPAQDLTTSKKGKSTRLLFSTITQNVGPGPLTLRGGEIVNGKSKQRVYQRIFDQAIPTGAFVEYPVGEFVYHPQHRHFHLGDYALYELIPLDAANANIQKRTSSKTSFCVQDTLQITWLTPPFGIDPTRNYIACDGSLQGMSRGWADRYSYQLAGQEIDTTSLPNGSYALQITVNPSHNVYETDFTDNVSSVLVQLVGGLLSPSP